MRDFELKSKAKNFVDVSKLDFKFKNPPLLVSGVAMMYHGFRESDKDIDMVLSVEDHKNLSLKLAPQAEILEEDHEVGYKDSPQFVDLYDDHGILIYEYELWDSIMLFDYQDLVVDAIKEDGYLVISLEKLLILSTIRGTKKKRYMEDAIRIAGELLEEKYDGHKFIKNMYWEKLLRKK